MIPSILNTKKEFEISQKKSFTEKLSEGYHFVIGNDSGSSGVRFIYYYKSEHSLIITHVWSNRVHVLSLDTGNLRWFDHHSTTVRSVQVCNHEIITASWDGTVCITDFDSLELRLILTEKEMARCPHVAMSPENDFVYSYSYDTDKNPHQTSNTIRKWSLSDGNLEKTLTLPGVHLSGRRCGSCEVDLNKLFVVSDTGHLHIYNSKTGSLITGVDYHTQLQTLCLLRAFNKLAIAGGEGNIYLCDLTGRNGLIKRKAHPKDISHLMVLPDRPEIIVSVGFDGSMKFWELPELELLESVEVSRELLWTISVVNDLIIVGGEDGELKLYDIKNLPGIKLKGKLVISDDSFALILSGSKSFFTSDHTMIHVVKNEDGNRLNGQFAEYLINSAGDFQIFRDLFCTDDHIATYPGYDNRGYLQIKQ
jgi:WD40 repeat protein